MYGIEKAVCEHQLAGFRPQSSAEPNEDMYHLARAYASDNVSFILTALSRLETRFHRRFIAALKMFMALRRANPVDSNPDQKEENECHSHSKSPSDPATTQSPNKSKPNCSQ
jgi:hypothetical protein